VQENAVTRSLEDAETESEAGKQASSCEQHKSHPTMAPEVLQLVMEKHMTGGGRGGGRK